MLAGIVFFEAKRSKAYDFARRRARSPGLVHLFFIIDFLQDMARQDGDAVENTFGSGVGLWKLEFHGICIDLPRRNWFSPDDEQVPLWRMDFFVEQNLEGENDVVGVERPAVRKPDATAQVEDVMATIP